MKNKKIKHNKEAKGTTLKTGVGEYVGVGVKNPIGRMIDSYMPNITPVSNKKIKKPPRSLA